MSFSNNRGAVTNNNVYFANKCWKIVRTTSTGGVKLIYNGTYTLTSKGTYNVETKSTISGTNLNYHHYTCGSSTSTTCTNVRYVDFVAGSAVFYMTLTGGVDGFNLPNARGVRPTVSLKPGLMPSYGDGGVGSPYVFE